jgi:hypothetical protein
MAAQRVLGQRLFADLSRLLLIGLSLAPAAVMLS